MKLTRRNFVIASGAAAVIGCKDRDPADTGALEGSPARDPEPGPWEDAPGTLDPEAFAWSLQSGDVTASSVLLSCRCLEESASIQIVRQDGESWVMHAEFSDLSPENGVVHLQVDDLSADTAYRWVVLSADGTRRSDIGRFRSALDADQDRVVVFGASSCLGRTGAPWLNLSNAAAQELDFFALLGDTVYADGSETREDYEAVWDQAMSTAGLHDLSASTSLVVTWDDHEVDNDWKAQNYAPELIEAATAVWRERMPLREGPGGTLYRHLRWGAVLDLFVLDCRGERGDDWAQMMSAEQLQWLAEALAASTARFKIVLTSIQVTDWSPVFGDFSVEDRWSGYPTQRAELLAACADIPGLLFITGDMHFGALSYVEPAGQPNSHQLEVMAGPSGSRVNPLPGLYTGDTEQYPVLITDTDQWTWCRFECDATLGTITLQFRDDADQIVAEEVLAL